MSCFCATLSFIFLPILPFFFGACLLFTFKFDGVEGKDDALSLHHLLISASRKGRENKVKRRVDKQRSRERARRPLQSVEQNGDWDRSCSSCGDTILHRDWARERQCMWKKRGIKQPQSMNAKYRRHTFPLPLYPQLSPSHYINQSLTPSISLSLSIEWEWHTTCRTSQVTVVTVNLLFNDTQSAFLVIMSEIIATPDW